MPIVRQKAGTKGADGKGIGGRFVASFAEAKISLKDQGAREQPAADAPFYDWAPRTLEERQAAYARVRARGQGAAAASLIKAYPDIVSARFVDIGSKYLTAENGMTMPNPDYVASTGRVDVEPPSFELRDVRLADGSVADEHNQPQFDSSSGRQSSNDFHDHALWVFNPRDEYDGLAGEFYKDHLHNQQVNFRDLVQAATPRPVAVDTTGNYVDTDTREILWGPTHAEREALGARTPKAALQATADRLVTEHGKNAVIHQIFRRTLEPELLSARVRLLPFVEASTARKKMWNPFRRN